MIQELVNEHALDPKNPHKIFELAKEYDRLFNGAMAVSLYLKAADLTDDVILQYKCMLGIGLCYDRQGHRRHTVEGALLDAVTLLPTAPDAYYFLSKFYAEGNSWKQSLFFATEGLNKEELYDFEVGYPGRKSMAVRQAIAKWHVTGQQDGRNMLFDMMFRTVLNDEDANIVRGSFNNIGYPDTIPYKQCDYNRFKFKFKGLESVTTNYSKHFQDLFVLSVFNGKRLGTYLEIGSGEPFRHSNTALLENSFGWKGISIDISPSLCYNFKENRRNTVICADATEIEFEDLFEKHCVEPVIDYLQIDCDEASIDVLNNIPFDKYKFGVVTLEHDSYRLGTDLRDQMRSVLLQHGYVLVVNDVAFDPMRAYEDWYVHPDVVDINPQMKSKRELNFVWDYFMEELNEDNERLI